MRRLVGPLLSLVLALSPVAEAGKRKPKAAHAVKIGKKRGKVKAVKVAKRGKGGKARRAARERAVPVYTRGGMPNIQAHSAVVVDLATGQLLFEKNPDEVRSIASLSKLMAMMVVLERNLNLDGVTEIVKADRDLARRGARSRLPVGMKFTNRDLLHAALMASDNRAVPALGRAVGLSPQQMAEAMTKRSQQLGLTHTSFGDPPGLDERNRSTPREVVRMLQAALKVPLIAEITQRPTYVASPVGRANWRIEYNNTDVIARSRRFKVLGGKTGYTDQAGYCLAIAARLSGGRDVGMAFLGAHGKLTRFADFNRTAQWIAEKRPSSQSAALTKS